MTYRFVRDSSLRIVQLGLLTEAVVRGFNYIRTPLAETSVVYDAAQETAPLAVWGSLFLAFGLLGLAGELWMQHRGRRGTTLEWSHLAWPSFVSHIGLMALFAAFAISAFVGVLTRSPVYGFVTPYDFVVFMLVHWAFARRRKRG
ncbi:hypothetical protein SEA_MARSHAWN_34 [Mycobacterium phage Marshawn]|uniref:Minor tail protein n=1 Tax=Mycobacterium phage Marshawn TaxID=2652423 RepID=A0A5P8D9Q8_9CAUD|nr:minor tail protein [Mycobacterium phage Marshawn]QFP94820.1 hypothetical protein SEA_MARSHAWN_34 [Mycobacterium phage Marshawn]